MTLIRNLTLELQAQELARKWFNMEWKYPIYINMNPTTNEYGCYNSVLSVDAVTGKKVRVPSDITINSMYDFTDEQMEDLLKHELCHWACQQRGMRYQDGDVDFEKELYRIGATSTETDFNIVSSRRIQKEIIEGMRGPHGSKYVRYEQMKGTHVYKTKYKVYYKNEYIGIVGKLSTNDHPWRNLTKGHPYHYYGYLTRKEVAEDLIDWHIEKKNTEEQAHVGF